MKPGTTHHHARGRWLVAFACLALLTACRSTARTEPPPPPVEAFVGTWRLIGVADTRLEDLLESSRPPTLTFAGTGGVAGFSGVNRFTTSLDREALARGRLVWREIASTRMAGPPEAMELERRFLDVLRKTDVLAIEDDRLILLDDGERVLTFEPAG